MSLRSKFQYTPNSREVLHVITDFNFVEMRNLKRIPLITVTGVRVMVMERAVVVMVAVMERAAVVMVA